MCSETNQNFYTFKLFIRRHRALESDSCRNISVTQRPQWMSFYETFLQKNSYAKAGTVNWTGTLFWFGIY